MVDLGLGFSFIAVAKLDALTLPLTITETTVTDNIVQVTLLKATSVWSRGQPDSTFTFVLQSAVEAGHDDLGNFSYQVHGSLAAKCNGTGTSGAPGAVTVTATF